MVGKIPNKWYTFDDITNFQVIFLLCGLNLYKDIYDEEVAACCNNYRSAYISFSLRYKSKSARN